MSRDVVVARYEEDISWTKLIESNVIVYDKSPKPVKNSIVLPNVGREGHTYIYHILTRWNSLADWTAFVQGYPWPHVKQTRETITSIDTCTDMFKPLGDHIAPIEFPSHAKHHGQASVDLSKQAFGNTIPAKTKFVPGACFIVHRDRIKAIEEAYWNRALVALSKESNPLAGYGMERLWMWLLTKN